VPAFLSNQSFQGHGPTTGAHLPVARRQFTLYMTYGANASRGVSVHSPASAGVAYTHYACSQRGEFLHTKIV